MIYNIGGSKRTQKERDIEITEYYRWYSTLHEHVKKEADKCTNFFVNPPRWDMMKRSWEKKQEIF